MIGLSESESIQQSIEEYKQQTDSNGNQDEAENMS